MKRIFLFFAFLFISCEIPIDTDTGGSSDSVLKIEAQYDANKRITDTLSVKLTWSEITLENFKEIQLWRYNTTNSNTEEYEDARDDGWVMIGSTANEFTTAWSDIIYDDDPFVYRVEYYDQNNNYKRAETTVTPRPTTNFTVPTDFEKINTAVESVLMDDGDTVFVRGGIYEVPTLSFRGKAVLLTKMQDSGTPILSWVESLSVFGHRLEDSTFIHLGNGSIHGIIIKNGLAKFGGGIIASGNSKITNCGIFENTATYSDGGDGGGLHLSGNAQVLNSIIYNNRASNLGGGIFVNGDAQNVSIINCTIVNNDIYTQSGNLQILNSVFHNSSLPTTHEPIVQYSYAGQEWQAIDQTNITGFLDIADLANYDFHLQPGSVGFDSGNPDPAYNDSDGTRNDIGAFGGPLGDWNFDFSDIN